MDVELVLYFVRSATFSLFTVFSAYILQQAFVGFYNTGTSYNWLMPIWACDVRTPEQRYLTRQKATLSWVTTHWCGSCYWFLFQFTSMFSQWSVHVGSAKLCQMCLFARLQSHPSIVNYYEIIMRQIFCDFLNLLISFYMQFSLHTFTILFHVVLRILTFLSLLLHF